MGKSASGRGSGGGGGGDEPGDALFRDEIEALSKALSLDTKNPRRALPSSTAASGAGDPRRSVSAGRSHPSSDPKPKPNPKPSSKEKKPSFWSLSPWRALAHLGRRPLDCRFALHVHSIDGVPPTLAAAKLAVHWKLTTDPPAAAVSTRPARVSRGVAEFKETLAYRCTVYATRSEPRKPVKYDPRRFLIYASVVGAPGIELGRSVVDLTRLLPLTLEEWEEEKGASQWSRSFPLSEKAKGALLNVSFEYSLVGSGSAESGGQKKVSKASSDQAGRSSVSERLGSIGRSGSQVRDLSRSRSVEKVKVLHEVPPSSKTDVPVFERELECEKNGGSKLGTLCVDSNPEFEVPIEGNEDSPELKHCTLPELVKGDEGSPRLKPSAFSQPGEVNEGSPDLKPSAFSQPGEGNEGSPDLKPYLLSEPAKGDEEKECDEPEFTVIEQGVEVASKDPLCESDLECINSKEDDKRDGFEQEEETAPKSDEQVQEASYLRHNPEESSSLPAGHVTDDLDSVYRSVAILETEESCATVDAKPSKLLSYPDVSSKNKAECKIGRSYSLDDTMELVASEFLSMLGMEQNSPFGLSSDSDPESPRERLWRQFEKESLISGGGIFGLDTGVEKEPDWGGYSEDFDLSPIIQEAELELQKATQALDSKSRAKMLEDAETEALMRKWGLDEKAFQSSPPGSRNGFGSPINLPPEEPLELPPLGEGLGPFIQTKNGGFLRSMNPSLFRTAKNDGSLIMQVSSPIVIPAEMGSGIMEILQSLASVGVEKLSMQANKLMPLEDITGKTMQQIAWEAAPALEAHERQDLSQYQNLEADIGTGQMAAGRRKKGKSLNLAPSSGGEMGSDYVSLEDLAPLAMDKIEALSIEGLRIQAGMSDEEAPSNICSQSVGEISALEGKGAKNSWSLGLEGTAGLQLLDVKGNGDDDVDGLMGLSLTLDEWMKLDSGIVDEEDQISNRASKILAAHHAASTDLISGGWKGDRKGGKKSGKRWGFLGNNFTVALMVQLRDPLRNYEPVGTPMLSLVQVERVFVPPKPKIYSTVSEKGNSEQDEETEAETKPLAEEKNEEEDAIPQYKITEVHVAGLKAEPGNRKPWGNHTQQQSGSRWLLATGMGKSNKHPFMKSKAVAKPSQGTATVEPGDTLWSISSRIHGTGAKWKELAALNPHIRNPNVIFPNETIRLR